VIGALALGVLVSGCGTTPFFFPITDQERQQVAALRAFRTAVSPQTNRAMSVFQRDVMSVLSLKLPTEYGVDLGPYFLPFPKVAIPEPPPGYQINKDGGKNLLGFIVQPQYFISALAKRNEQTGAESWQYDLVMQPNQQGQSGTLKVMTSGASWQGRSTESTATKPYIFGMRYTRLPDSVQAKAELNLQQNAGKATFNVSLGSFQVDGAGSDLLLPQSVSFDGSIPGLSWYLNGMMSMTTAVKLQGTLTVQGTQGSDSYMVEATSVNGDVTMRLLNEEKGFEIDLYLQAGKLKGQAKSRVDRRYLLADIIPNKDGKVIIKFGDGSQEVLF
jgi:hypothetical protein